MPVDFVEPLEHVHELTGIQLCVRHKGFAVTVAHDVPAISQAW
jgi:hypothetical protein